MFAIAWQYLLGRAAASDVVDRKAVEWPPHPDRVFQALVAAWGETTRDDRARLALEWLEQLPPPEVAVPAAVSAGAVPTTFVPSNDVQAPARGAYRDTQLGLLPSERKRSPRVFPSMVVGDGACALRWPGAALPDEHRRALTGLCRAVTHVGHSRSLVRMWLAEDPPAASWIPAAAGARGPAVAMRVLAAGRLDALVRAYADGVGDGWQRPPASAWQPYVPASTGEAPVSGAFAPNVLVLRRVSGDRPALAQTLAFTEALRGCLLSKASDRAKAIISGHGPDGSPVQFPHLAFLPLAAAGHAHADGHLLGLGLALPRDLPPDGEQAVYDAVAAALDRETDSLRLVAGRAGAAGWVVEDRPAPPLALRSETWCRPSAAWATVTPLVLDRLPPKRVGLPPAAQRDQWSAYDAWVAEQVTQACTFQGLPAPVEIAVAAVSRHAGVPPCRAFPPLLRRSDGARRWHVHVSVVFPGQVCGPLVLGAGRYRGYGVFKPVELP